MRRYVIVVALSSLPLSACDRPTPVEPSSSDGAALAEAPTGSPYVRQVFIDFRDFDTHAGPGPHPTQESDRFTLMMGGIRWFTNGSVEYRIEGTEPVNGANDEIETAVETWDAFVTTRSFSRNDASNQVDPCSDPDDPEPSTIRWATIDGPGGIAGTAAPCFMLATKEIVGFEIVLDVDETWSTTGAADALDVRNVASHEFGHASGLDHVNAPRDGCLAMYRYVTDGETQKRTLGWGDKLGMNRLYGPVDTDPGSCGS